MDLLTNVIKDYPWGSRTAIAELTGRPATGPEAEMWLGAHPAAPSRLTRGGAETTLTEVVAADPVGTLGEAVAGRFGARLPYLMKLIAVAAPLSLQVHPDAGQAADGHARGNVNYIDPWHKPEMVCALTPFTGLAGFRPPEQSAMLVERLHVDALTPVVAALRDGDVLGALRVLLEWPAPRRELVEAVVWAASAVHTPDYALVVRLARRYPEDPAVLAPLLMRRHALAPGEALFLGAGVLHCYLDGFAVEIMACSDNVLRAGLTGKRVDVEELLRITDPAAQPLPVEPVGGAYVPPVPEFLLRRTAPGAGETLAGGLPRIVLCTEGVVGVATAGGSEVKLRPGESVFAAASEGSVEIGGDGVAFCAEPQA
ncbi:putative mannose-6-phosphate isomerase ManA [Microbispora rosea subsp. aerata]|nr:mannose-6-phosphate isomerase, class I [Microbispora rosea]GGO29601.1 putative mannose-6-phosphate isomerase ManA [Microbispora rosea subsp. aerata]GIH57673.1 putative mannose-6-phosphate isomerase ManA [Microbispora rosea subsp. aerata]GLJ86675.1 putative mannose-6-phosphate isomerase ManA [Microbispora rosea subsp. aerata]